MPWAEFPRPVFPDYCSGVFYILSGQVDYKDTDFKVVEFWLFVQSNHFRPVISFWTPLKLQTSSKYDETNAKLHFFSEHLDN